MKFKHIILALCLLGVSLHNVKAQNGSISRDVSLNLTNITTQLTKAPMEFSTSARFNPLPLSLPMPNGEERRFNVVESPIMDAAFAALYPTFKTYTVVAEDNPRVTGRISVTPYGLNAFIFLESGTMGIRPRDLLNPVQHQVYIGNGDTPSSLGKCQFDESLDPNQGKTTAPPSSPSLASITNGATRRTYRFAIVTTSEFTANNGGTISSAAAVVLNSVNAIQAIYDRELSVRFTLLTPFSYTDAGTDPFVPEGSGGDSRPNLAAEAVNINFTSTSYDIGHVLHNSTGNTFAGGGVAGLGVVCSTGTFFATQTSGNPNEPDGLSGFDRAAGWSGSSNNTSNGWYGLFAHEVGHMFDMPHTFNGTGGSCTSAISTTTAYEIGSGNSLMSYNGICSAAQNITDGGTADDYFHANSLDKAVTYMGTISCQTSASTGNTPPVINANPCGGAYTIPVNTPFTLTGSGTDANGDVIYYSWEQYDEDGAGTATQGLIGAAAGANAAAPLFRSFPPTTSPSRTFPTMSAVVTNGYATDFEPLPTVARTLNFRLTGRDYNTNGGGIHSMDMSVTVSGAAFSVSAPNGGESLSAGGTTTVTWAVGGTTGYCSTVNIKLSTDGGYTYPYTLATATANDGSESISLPSGLVNVSTARVKVECADNTCVVFFDISNADFTIVSTCNAPATTIAPTQALSTSVGNASLNLGLTNDIGTVVTSLPGTITATDNAGTLIFSDGTPASCVSGGNSINYDTYGFSVDVTGSYTISRSGSGIVLNLYSNPYTANSCTNHIACSATRPSGSGPVSLGSNLTATLTAGQLYTLVVSSFGPSTPTLPGAYTVTFPSKPSGANVYNGVILPANYSYTYLAVNTGTSNIAAVSSTSDFTSLAAGSYQIYGAVYYTGSAPPNPATPASWVGSSLSSVLSSSTCQLFSSNNKSVTVTGVLPVDLLNLQATPLSSTVKLTWQTAYETNNKGFQVERRQETGDKWDVLGFVATKGKAANYEFTDNAPLSNNYYRLRQIDHDGTENLSKVVTASLNKSNKLKAFPNPVSNVLNIESNQTGDFYILNLLGQQVLSGKVRQQIDVSALPQGTYILKIGLEQVKFVKQ